MRSSWAAWKYFPSKSQRGFIPPLKRVDCIVLLADYIDSEVTINIESYSCPTSPAHL